MTKLAIVGDTHGNLPWVVDDVISYVKREGVAGIVQVGDFGFIWPDPAAKEQLEALDEALGREHLHLTFLPGNHEDHDQLRLLEFQGERNVHGHVVVTPNIVYTGRVSSWSWWGRRFAAVGGAVSIDRDQRVAQERDTGEVSWWPEEVLSEEEHQASLQLGRVDVLLTHDAPSSYPVEGLKADLDSTANRQRMTDLGRALLPKLWFHGHYHRRLTYAFHHDAGVAEVHSLGRDIPVETRFGVEFLDLSG